MAGSLIETLAGDFDPTQYHDQYREALQQVIEAKVEGRDVVQPAATQPTSGTVVDLMAALRASVEAARKQRPGAAAPPPDTGSDDAPRDDAADGNPSAPGRKPAATPPKRGRKPAVQDGAAASARRSAADPAAGTASRKAAKTRAPSRPSTRKTA